MNIKSVFRKLRFWRKQRPPQHAPLWRILQNRLYLGHIIGRSEWAVIIRTVAAEIDSHVVEDAGAPIGIYYKENPVDWLKREAARAESRL